MPSSESHPPQRSESASTPPKPPPLPLYSYSTKSPNAQLYYVRYVDAANRAISLLGNGPLGFDLEWKPNYVKGEVENRVALVQLANDQAVLLIQISAMQEFPEKLKEVLENPHIVKAGVGIKNDTLKLYKDHGVSVCHCVDLSLLARTADNKTWKGKYNNSIGLSRLLEHYEKRSLVKGKTTRSNWENQLSYTQQEYAANDAHAGYTIYNKLLEISGSMPVIPDPVYYTFDAVRGRLCEPSGAEWHPYNPNYDPGPPPPPKPPKSPNAANVVVTGTSPADSESATTPLFAQAAAPRAIVTANPQRNPWRPNQSNQRWLNPHPPHNNIGNRPPEMGRSNPHSNFNYDARHVPLNNRFASHGGWNSRTPRSTAEGNSAQYSRPDILLQQQPGAHNSSPTGVPRVSQHNYGVPNSVAGIPVIQKKPRRRLRRKSPNSVPNCSREDATQGAT